jgi:uncharacterized protein (TIGR03067 family)
MAMTALVGSGTVLSQQASEKEDLKQMQGVWRVVKIDGQGEDKDELKDARVIIRGNKLELRLGKATLRETVFSLDPKKQPKWINIQFELKRGEFGGGKLKEVKGIKETSPGIYEIKGDTLRLCISGTQERPKVFSGSISKKRIVMVLEREKKAK